MQQMVECWLARQRRSLDGGTEVRRDDPTPACHLDPGASCSTFGGEVWAEAYLGVSV